MKVQPEDYNYIGFSITTYSAVCSLLGVDKNGKNTGLQNALHEIYQEQFINRTNFTMGEVVDAYARRLLGEGRK